MGRIRRVSQPIGWAAGLLIAVVVPTFRLLTKSTVIDGEKIPAKGAAIIVANHLSYADPLMLGTEMFSHGRLPRFLGKDSIFKVPIVGVVSRSAGQIPVLRSSAKASQALVAAEAALAAGESLCIYPEGTITKDPDHWPMRGKTGAAQLALTTGAPVVPIGQWGIQELLAPYAKRPTFFPRARPVFKVGDPVDLSEFEGKTLDREILQAATDKIMDAITQLVEETRGRRAPKDRFDPKSAA